MGVAMQGNILPFEGRWRAQRDGRGNHLSTSFAGPPLLKERID